MSARARRPARLAARRGAVLPLVCILLVALLGFGAAAVDLGRLHYVGAEVQTVADAGALAAARAMQLQPASAAAAAQDAAKLVGAANRAGGRDGSVAAVDVRAKVYTASGGALVDAASWSQANAVEVTARTPGSSVLAGALGLVIPEVARTATAWIANVNAAACVSPVMLPYSSLYYLGFGSAQPRPAPNLTQSQLGQLGAYAPSYRTVALVPPDADAVSLANGGLNNYGNWGAADFTGRGLASEFGDWVARRDCDGARAEVGRPGVVTMAWPGPAGGAVLQAAQTNVAAVCNFRGAGSATCWAGGAATVPGVRTRVVFGDYPAGAAQGQPVTVRAVGELRVMCYFRAPADNCPDQPGYPGGWYTPQFPNTGYPAGTVIGVIDAPVSVDLERTMVLGDVVGNVQRVILVK